jgi:hypothetical protein
MHDQLTLFCCPKPFCGHIGIIQRNAIRSWLHLQPAPRVLLFGDEAGTAELATELALPHHPSLARTSQGTPRVDALFAAAQTQAGTPWLGYINADILLLDDFAQAFALFQREAVRLGLTRTFLTSQRVDIQLHEPIDFAKPAWRAEIRQRVERTGARMKKDAIDLFVFSRDLYDNLPPLALGRTAWDNYLVWRAGQAGASVVDGSEAFLLVHQCHDYAHAGGRENAWKGEEALNNWRLVGDRFASVSKAATHRLDRTGLRTGRAPDRSDYGALAIQRVRAGTVEMERGNQQGAKDFFGDAIRWIEELQRCRDKLERRRLINRLKRLVGKSADKA